MEMLMIYLAICLVGFILLLIITISGGLADMGGDFDIGDVDMDMDMDVDAGDFDAGAGAGPSALSLPVILIFITGFGAFGVIFEILDFRGFAVPILAIIGGVVIAAFGFFLLVKLFSILKSDSTVKMSSLVGKRGMVQVPIKKGKEGQVMVITESRGRFLIGAISDENIPNEAVVKVEEVIGDIVRVKYVGKKKGSHSKSKSSKKKKKNEVR